MRNNSELRQQMFEMIEQWKQSGLTQKVFCERQAIKHHSFYYWYKRYSQQHPDIILKSSSFVKLQIEKTSGTPLAEVHFPDGIRLLFHEAVSANYLKALIS